MSAQFKPGDVAIITERPRNIGARQQSWAAAKDDKGWASLHPSIGWIPDADVAAARPLVVIDPEDAEQVERLVRLLINAEDLPNLGEVGATQAALREFANPKPPKPDEPTGWLAVVVDANGDKWVRDGLNKDRASAGAWWNHSCAARDYVGGELRADYSEIDAVEVLSDGNVS